MRHEPCQRWRVCVCVCVYVCVCVCVSRGRARFQLEAQPWRETASAVWSTSCSSSTSSSLWVHRCLLLLFNIRNLQSDFDVFQYSFMSVKLQIIMYQSVFLWSACVEVIHPGDAASQTQQNDIRTKTKAASHNKHTHINTQIHTACPLSPTHTHTHTHTHTPSAVVKD